MGFAPSHPQADPKQALSRKKYNSRLLNTGKGDRPITPSLPRREPSLGVYTLCRSPPFYDAPLILHFVFFQQSCSGFILVLRFQNGLFLARSPGCGGAKLIPIISLSSRAPSHV